MTSADIEPDKCGMAALQSLLAECVARVASDIHLTPGLPAHLRVDGELLSISGAKVLTGDDCQSLARALVNPSTKSLDQLIAVKGSLDGAISSPDGARFRYNVFKRQGMFAIVIRRLEDRFRTLPELGLPATLYRLCEQRDGLIVISGATGSGKSTTLASLIDRINRNRAAHIVTIEDPIEYIHKPVQSVINQRQIGLDAPSFNDALVSSLRQDPDVILVGEIRDLDTIRTAITAAETGHLVFTTLHAGDCVSSIERLVSVFPADEQDGIRRQLSLVLRAVVAQHLLPCARPDDRTNQLRRVAASEVLMITPAIANLTATAKTAQIYSSMETGQALGMQTLEQDLARLWAGGEITETVAVGTARNATVLRDRFALLKSRHGKSEVLLQGGAR